MRKEIMTIDEEEIESETEAGQKEGRDLSTFTF